MSRHNANEKEKNTSGVNRHCGLRVNDTMHITLCY